VSANTNRFESSSSEINKCIRNKHCSRLNLIKTCNEIWTQTRNKKHAQNCLGPKGKWSDAPSGLYNLSFPKANLTFWWWVLLTQTRIWWLSNGRVTLTSGTDELLYKHRHAWSRSQVAAPLPA
jgi:hypothetical protein